MSMTRAPFNIRRMLDADFYPHPVSSPRLVETHISWVVLTGEYAYKVKKPLDLGFLDFSTLERRALFCHEELRLNGRLAPGIYLEVLPITGRPEAPVLNGEGAAVEYTLKMRQFPQEGLLDRLIAQGRLWPAHVDAIARQVADFHGRIAVAGQDSPFGTPERAHYPVAENFRQTLPLVRDPDHTARLEALASRAESAYEKLTETMRRRKSEGFIRECHGDMHLGNMAEVDGQVIIFDGIEFNENLRWIDVTSEVAFLSADFAHRGRPDFAWRFLNGYLELTGDYEGLALLRYYQAYRAMVRAKVTAIRLAQPSLSADEARDARATFEGYLAQAEAFSTPRRPALIITRGPSGAGKSVQTEALSEHLGAVRLRSDVTRKRLFGLSPLDRSRSMLDSGIYTPAASQRTFEHLRDLAGRLLQAEHTVIVDATFLQRAGREPFRELARGLGIPFRILDIQTSPALLRERVSARAEAGADASEADREVLERQLASYGPLDADEQAEAVSVDGSQAPDPRELVARLRG